MTSVTDTQEPWYPFDEPLPPKPKNGTKVIGVKVDSAAYKLIQRAARKRDMPLNDYVRDVLDRASRFHLERGERASD
jgi:hypothetical protein